MKSSFRSTRSKRFKEFKILSTNRRLSAKLLVIILVSHTEYGQSKPRDDLRKMGGPLKEVSVAKSNWITWMSIIDSNHPIQLKLKGPAPPSGVFFCRLKKQQLRYIQLKLLLHQINF